MKKLISLILAALLALSCDAFATLAEEVVIELPQIDFENEIQTDDIELNQKEQTLSIDDLDLIASGVNDILALEDPTLIIEDEEKISKNSESEDVLVGDILYRVWEDRASVWAAKSAESLTIQATVLGRPVTGVDYSFSSHYMGDVKKLTIMADLTSDGWGDGAFNGCSSLEEVVFSSCKVIGMRGFENCKALKKVTLPDDLVEIEYGAFSGCSSLESITFPDGLNFVGGRAFDGCLSLTKVAIPASVEEIQPYAFGYCDEINKIDGFTICGEAGSVAEDYAEKNGIAFDDGTTSITITNGASVELEMDETLQLKTTVTPSNPKVKRIWTTSDNKIVTVSADGLVTGVAKGTATITVSTLNGNMDSIEITVVGPQPTKIAITNGKTISVDVDAKKQLNVKLTPANAETTLTWKSSHKKIAKVDAKGMVKGVKKGSAIITVTTKNGKTASIKVNVVAPVPTSITINQGKSATLYMGNTLKLTTKFAPVKAESKLTWTSSDPKVAAVSKKGVVTAKKAGTAKITVKTANGKSATITITVK